MNRLQLMVDSGLCETTTGCDGAGRFLAWAESQGYPYCAVLDWTSSAGDWSFIVSQDGELWQLMTQENNFPKRGFTRIIHEDDYFEGTEDDAIDYFSAY